MSYVLPRTVVGLALWVLIFAIGAGASGVVFFIAYERRLTGLESRITSVQSDFEQRLADAVAQLQQADRANAVTGTGAAGPVAQANRLIATVGPSLVTVQGTDAAGARTSGSGFVMNSTANQSWLITNYHLVAGSIAAAQGVPAPVTPTDVAPPVAGLTPRVTVHLGGSDRTGTVYSWDAPHDLALVVVGIGKVPALAFSSAVPSEGLPVWAVGVADGPVGAAASKGRLIGPMPESYATDAVFGPRASGGPLVDTEGKVVGVLTATATVTPAPPTGTAVPVRLACIEVVVCPR
ncbi:MAG: putative serine protease PepD [Actinomycetota bacterium]|nr:putative serine protease PepD [Actinomycetota bacterium]